MANGTFVSIIFCPRKLMMCSCNSQFIKLGSYPPWWLICQPQWVFIPRDSLINAASELQQDAKILITYFAFLTGFVKEWMTIALQAFPHFDNTLNLSSNLGISLQELCPHPARADTAFFNLFILFCWNLTKTLLALLQPSSPALSFSLTFSLYLPLQYLFRAGLKTSSKPEMCGCYCSSFVMS